MDGQKNKDNVSITFIRTDRVQRNEPPGTKAFTIVIARAGHSSCSEQSLETQITNLQESVEKKNASIEEQDETIQVRNQSAQRPGRLICGFSLVRLSDLRHL